MLWCDGLKTTSKKRKSKKKKADASDPEEIVESGCESDQDDFLFGKLYAERRKRYCERGTRRTCTTVDQTPKGQTWCGFFTPMQIQIWSEMIAGDLHSSLDDPPTTSMFMRAGDESANSSRKIKNDNNSLTEAFTQAATAALSPSPRPHSDSPACSQLEARSKCYKQLAEVNNLRLTGVLNEEEYAIEKDAVLQVLKGLNNRYVNLCQSIIIVVFDKHLM